MSGENLPTRRMGKTDINPHISCVLTGAAIPEETEQNLKDANGAIPEDVWSEAMDRVARLDEEEKKS